MIKYAKYKNSGIEWLGEIPEHWEVDRLKNLAVITTGSKNTEDRKENGEYPFFVRSQSVERIDTYSFDGEAILTAGDGVGVGKVFHHFFGKFETHQRVYRISNFNNLAGRYFYYFFKENLNTVAQMNNSKSTVDSLRLPLFTSFPTILPPLKEQTAIATYLDRKTKAIDQKINLLTQKTAKYKELRKALINQTVTKGLDKTVKLKNSGIEWIGEIPEHWEVRRLKEIATIQTGNTPPMSDKGNYSEKGMPWVKPNDLFNFVPIVDSTDNISPKGQKIIRRIKKDSVLVCCIGSIGKMGVAGVDLCTNQQINALTFNYLINASYGKYLIYSSQKEHLRISTGNVVAILNSNSQKRIEFAVPPLKEQTAIAQYLDEQTGKIDTIVSNIAQQINTLKELRKTLINDVVTGKIKVV